jgi:cell division protease FtsH
MALLRQKGVVVNAKSPTTGSSVLVTILLYFGPTLLLVPLFVWMMRRAAGGISGGIGAFGRSRAQRVEPSQQHVNFEDVAGIDEAKEELTELVDFLKDPDPQVPPPGRPDPARRAAHRPARHGQDAAGAGAGR